MNKYQGVSLPKDLLNQIDAKLHKHGYLNKVDFIRQAIRIELERLNKLGGSV